MSFGSVDWPAVAVSALVVLAVLAVAVLVFLALRTRRGQEAATNAGLRLTEILLAWVEKWLLANLSLTPGSRNVTGLPPSTLSRRIDAVRRAGDLVAAARLSRPA